jgi:hypothetical protein
MTAIGFAMVWVSVMVGTYFYDNSLPVSHQNDRFVAATLVCLAGMITVLTGVTIWLYGVMP